MNSFQPQMKAKTRAATSAGLDIGSTTRTRAPTLVQPSIMAASSISMGIDSKYPARNHTEKAKLNAAYVVISDALVSTK